MTGFREAARSLGNCAAPPTRAGGGEGGIRTPGTVTRTPHFECGAFNHSATSPSFEIIKQTRPSRNVCYGNLLLSAIWRAFLEPPAGSRQPRPRLPPACPPARGYRCPASLKLSRTRAALAFIETPESRARVQRRWTKPCKDKKLSQPEREELARKGSRARAEALAAWGRSKIARN